MTNDFRREELNFDKHQQLYQKIISFAENNDLIRIVEMNGSRVNPNVEPDLFQDFDIVYYVSNIDVFINDETWLKVFGKPLLRQTSKDQRDGLNHDWFIYMMQYEDGTRLDLTLYPVERFLSKQGSDSLSLIVIDKEGYQINHVPNESSYYVQPLDQQSLDYSVNEFYWLASYVAKGIKRNHIFYAHQHIQLMRQELDLIMDWWIGHHHQYQISVGKGKSRYISLLPNALYQRYCSTYTGLNIDELYHALITLIELYDHLAKELTKAYGMIYPSHIKTDVLRFIKHDDKI